MELAIVVSNKRLFFNQPQFKWEMANIQTGKLSEKHTKQSGMDSFVASICVFKLRFSRYCF